MTLSIMTMIVSALALILNIVITTSIRAQYNKTRPTQRSESEKEKDAQIIELRSRVAKLKEENAVLEMEKEEERTIVESWVNGYNKLTKEKAALEAQLKAKEQALLDLQKDYAELKEAQELAIMRPIPKVFPESNGVDDRWEGDKGGLEE